MVSVIKTDSGRYNVVVTESNMFALQGNLDLIQLKKLRKKIDQEIKKAG